MNLLPAHRQCLTLDTGGIELVERPISSILGHAHVPHVPHVRIALVMAGICRTDLAVARGDLPVRRPRVLGHEAAGIVVDSSGSDARRFVGQKVAIDPRVDGFLGVNTDGAFATSIDLPCANAIVLTPNLPWLRAAYLEPIAAALGAIQDLRAARRPAIVGNNRLARITKMLAETENIDLAWVHHSSELSPRTFDVIVESDPQLVESALFALRNGGTLIAKSRPSTPVAMPLAEIVSRGLRIKGVAYGDFETAADKLADPSIPFEDLFGPTFELADFNRAFAYSSESEDHKTFLRLAPI
ncbi:MAG: alcohol dehydrogenase catalytic domain-containing protein [Myxococcota bacterium]